MTAEEDKAVFEEIIKAVIGDEVNSNTLANVYDEINSMLLVEEESTPTLDTKEIEHVLKASGVKDVNTEKVERVFQHVVEDKTYEMKASIYRSELRVQIQRCLLIKAEEDTMIEGFKLLQEELLEWERLGDPSAIFLKWTMEKTSFSPATVNRTTNSGKAASRSCAW